MAANMILFLVFAIFSDFLDQFDKITKNNNFPIYYLRNTCLQYKLNIRKNKMAATLTPLKLQLSPL